MLDSLLHGKSNFNPRSHAGSDVAHNDFFCIPITISIHAPTRGATSAARAFPVSLIHFNPRSHAGSDDIVILYYSVTLYFNPRSHAGSDFVKPII